MAETIIKFYLSCPAGESLWSPNGIALILQGAKPVRLPGGGVLFYEEKKPKVLQGAALKTRNASEPPRPETLRIPGAGLDDAYKAPQAHFM